MAFVATATAVGFGSAVLGTAIIGAGVGGLYSAITKDGDVLNSMLTGGLIGAGVGAMLPAATVAPTVGGLTATGATTPALAAQGAGGTMGGISAGGAFTPSASSAANFALPSLSAPASYGGYTALGEHVPANVDAFITGNTNPAGAFSSPSDIGASTSSSNFFTKMTGPQKLAAGLAGTTALSYLGGQNQPTIQEQEEESYIRPYTYSQTRNPRYGEPGESYFTQSYTAQTPYRAARGGIMRMAEGGASSPAAAPVSSGVGIVPLAAPSSQYGPAVGSPEAQVAGLYRNVLGRAPDATGGKFWEDALRSGAGIADIKNLFIASPENQTREAQRTQVAQYNNLLAERAKNEYLDQPAPLSTLPGRGQFASAPDVSKIINRYYQQNLGRAAEPEGLEFWTNAVRDSGMKLGDVAQAIRTSPEGTARQQAQQQAAQAQQQAAQAQQQAALEQSPEYQAYMSAPITAENFDAAAYLAAHPDMAALPYWAARPYEHYLKAHELGDMRTATKKPFQLPAQPGRSGYTYNPITKSYTAPPAATPAQEGSGLADIYQDPNFQSYLQNQYNQYQQAQYGGGGGKAGGLMPNNLRYSNGGEAIDTNSEKMRMISAINQRLNESPQMMDQRNQHEFMMRTDPNYRASMSPPLQGMIEGAQYGDRMTKSYGSQPRDFNVMPTTVDPSTRSYGGIASIGAQIDPETRINAMANLYRSPYDKNAAESVRRLGGGISRQIGKDANLSAYYEQDPMGRSKQGGVRYSQNFNQGGDIQGYNLGGYSDGGRLLKGPGDGVSDDIPAVIGDRQPARLADGEFVIPARIVSELGNGSTDAGAKRLYAMMDKIQAGRKKTVGKGNVAKDTKAKKHLLA